MPIEPLLPIPIEPLGRSLVLWGCEFQNEDRGPREQENADDRRYDPNAADRRALELTLASASAPGAKAIVDREAHHRTDESVDIRLDGIHDVERVARTPEEREPDRRAHEHDDRQANGVRIASFGCSVAHAVILMRREAVFAWGGSWHDQDWEAESPARSTR